MHNSRLTNILFEILACCVALCKAEEYNQEYSGYGCETSDIQPIYDELYEMRQSAKADCELIEFDGTTDIYPFGSGTMTKTVYCDASTTGGRWLILQSRTEESENFYRPWQDYAAGFGNASADHWVGLEVLHSLTSKRDYVFRVELSDENGETRFAEYSLFKVGSKRDYYRLTIGGYYGNAGDSLSYHNGMEFSTFDRDNDPEPFRNCAKRYLGAWWYKTCYQSNLNGAYGAQSIDGIRWNKWKLKSLVRTRLMMRRIRL